MSGESKTRAAQDPRFPALEPSWFNLRNGLLAVAGYSVVYAAFWVFASFYWGGVSNAGIFGDMFGAFNAFVSGLAMLGVIVAILLQRDQNRMQAQELALQREELVHTREELKGQKEALQEQNDQARRATEATLMQHLMDEYDSLRPSLVRFREWTASFKGKGLQMMVAALENPQQNPSLHAEALTVDADRHRVSRFFVKVRRLVQAGYLPEDLVVISLERGSIKMFLEEIDPADRAVAGTRWSDADRTYFSDLLTRRYFYRENPDTAVRPSFET